MFRESGPSPENRESPYSLDRLTVEPAAVKEMPGRLRDFDWPVELNGKGESDREHGTMLLRYPRGDVFLSYATTIHELGHLRQHEQNPALQAHDEKQTPENLKAEEADAWARGWQRFLRTDAAASLERHFQEKRRQGQLARFSSFAEMFNWVRDNVLASLDAQAPFFDSSLAPAQRIDAVADALEAAGFRGFLEQFAAARTGETVDDAKMQEFVRSAVALIIKE